MLSFNNKFLQAQWNPLMDYCFNT